MDLFKLTDKKIFKKLGQKVYIRNGIGYGFISTEFLYDNALLEIGIGRTTSGYGDWGGGATHSTTCPLKISIDKNYVIHKVETDSFYNSKDSKRVERIAESFLPKLAVGKIFNVRDEFLKECIDKLFTIIPCKKHIGFDVFESPHIIKYFIEDKADYSFRDSLSVSSFGREKILNPNAA